MPNPAINDTKLLLQIIREARSDYSVIREAISNAFDAGSTLMEIDITENATEPGTSIDIVFADNGTGMSDNGNSPPSIYNFFNIADSGKQGGSAIGEKGVGAKLFFNSMSLEVLTKRPGSNAHYWKMDSPVATLEMGQMPHFDQASIPLYMHLIDTSQGTTIKITGLRVASALAFLEDDRRSMLLKDYINFFTVAGNIRKFIPGFRAPDFSVSVYRYNPNNPRPNTPTFTINEHNFPSDNRDPRDQHRNSKPEDFVYKFGPIVTNGYIYDNNNKPVRQNIPITILGFIAGNNGHGVESGGQWYKGLFLAKDGFIIRRYNELMTDQSYYNYRIIANCQDFELNLGRDDFRNTNSVAFAAVENALREFIGELRSWREPKNVSRNYAYAWKSSCYLMTNLLSKEGPNPPANGIDQPGVPFAEEGYRLLSKLKQEDEYHKELMQMKKLKKKYEDEIAGISPSETRISIDNFTGIMFSPKNESSTILLFHSLIEKRATHIVNGQIWFDAKQLKIIQHFHEGVDFLCERSFSGSSDLVWIEAEYLLMNALTHEHPIDSLFAIVCWDIDLSLQNKMRQNGTADFINKGKSYDLAKDKNGYYIHLASSGRRVAVYCIKKILADLGFSVEPNYAERGSVVF